MEARLFKACGASPISLLPEGVYLDEGDIIRFDDKYGQSDRNLGVKASEIQLSDALARLPGSAC